MNKEILTSLLDKQTQLQTRINAIEADFKKGRSQDFSEQTSENENNEVLNEIHQEAKVELKLIKDAIVRIESDSYGVCAVCAEPINPQRLQVLPYIDTCISCAK